jgi:hypothetical protein
MEVGPLHRESVETLFRGFSAEDVHTLSRLLNRLLDNVPHLTAPDKPNDAPKL